jgi:hypothetical protein
VGLFFCCVIYIQRGRDANGVAVPQSDTAQPCMQAAGQLGPREGDPPRPEGAEAGVFQRGLATGWALDSAAASRARSTEHEDHGGGGGGAGGGRRGSADRGVKGSFDPPEQLLTSFHTVLAGGSWRPRTFFTIVLTPLTP